MRKFSGKAAACIVALAMIMPTGLVVVSPALASPKPAQFHRAYVPAPCSQYFYNTAARRDCVASYTNGDHMSRAVRSCLLGAIGTAFGVAVGGFIGGFVAKQIAAAVVGGGAGGCLTVVLQET